MPPVRGVERRAVGRAALQGRASLALVAEAAVAMRGLRRMAGGTESNKVRLVKRIATVLQRHAMIDMQCGTRHASLEVPCTQRVLAEVRLA